MNFRERSIKRKAIKTKDPFNWNQFRMVKNQGTGKLIAQKKLIMNFHRLYKTIKRRKVKCISKESIIESLSSSNFSISCWVDEANREAILTLLSVNLTLLLEIMHCARNLQIIH